MRTKKRRSTATRILRYALSLGLVAVLATAVVPQVTEALTRPGGQAFLNPFMTTTTVKSSTTTTYHADTVPADLSGLTAYEDTNAGLVFSGSWRSTRGPGLSAGSAKYASKAGTSLTVYFQGTSLTWIGMTSRSGGQALVTVDGGDTFLVDLYTPTTSYQQAVFTTGTLAAGSHVVRIEASGKKSANSRGTQVYVDTIGLAGSLTSPGGTTGTTTSPATTTTTLAVVAPTTTTTTLAATTTTTAASTTTTAAPTTTTTVAPPVSNFQLQAAINAATAGSTINIPDGTYTGPFNISGKANLTLRGSVSAILTAKGADVLTIYSSSNIVLEGFTLVGDYLMRGQKCVTVSGLTGGAFRNLTVRDAGNSGIYAYGTFSNITISNCNITHCGDFGISFQAGANGVTIENCTLSGFASLQYPGHGIYARSSANVTISNCVVSNVRHLSANGDGGFQIADCTNAQVVDCLSYDNEKYGFIVDGGTATFIRCQGRSNGVTDFYECGCDAPSTYAGCTGTFSKYPN